jgi:hypothetical protein
MMADPSSTTLSRCHRRSLLTAVAKVGTVDEKTDKTEARAAGANAAKKAA